MKYYQNIITTMLFFGLSINIYAEVMTMKRTKPWNVKQLNDAMIEDLEQCDNVFERNNCQAICLKGIVQTARQQLELRKLTPGEWSIIKRWGLETAVLR
jgi:hypothetical protein